MKKINKTIILITLALSGCTAVSPENKKYQNTCNFISMPEPSYKIQVDPDEDIIYGDFRDGIEYESKIIPNKLLAGQKIKFISFSDNYRAAYQAGLYLANGPKTYITGYLKGVTEKCQIAYLTTSDIYEEVNYSQPDPVVKLSGQPLDANDKIELSKLFANRLNDLSVSIERDDFEGSMTITTPEINSAFLRAGIDVGSKSLSYVQIYAMTYNFGEWLSLERASDRQQNSFELISIDKDVKCESSGCAMYETVGVMLSAKYLAQHLDGIEVQVSGRGGKSLIYIPSPSVKLMLDAIKKYSDES